ncbi:MAG: hypothetical protein KGK01_02760 [Bradyrhizobium sp.]|uniref:hypothetical protein n=1 Tax=Bradyrhizobium sp. TaxID=376 RepID=UPI001C29E7D6|nr:hypothetical protein [Bradyrhizobium sp.]MBU6461627.1 hypothetical protein [Pseudomonadota bacterium]MDE2067534.1 hypothetical protein [Bradyrhizobium sp.]MDE2241382.1 hypothetical protein [Bradyrhizobium sp.]
MPDDVAEWNDIAWKAERTTKRSALMAEWTAKYIASKIERLRAGHDLTKEQLQRSYRQIALSKELLRKPVPKVWPGEPHLVVPYAFRQVPDRLHSSIRPESERHDLLKRARPAAVVADQSAAPT